MHLWYSRTRQDSKSIKFKKILDKYFENNERYVQGFNYEDAMFGYTEMANVSALSTAAWQLGYLSIVEYQDAKYTGKNLSKNKKKNYKYGRVDLYITDETEEFICEAKQTFTSGATIDTPKIVKSICAAIEDVQRSTKNAKDKKLDGYGIVFIPHLSKNNQTDESAIKVRIEDLKKSLKSVYDKGFSSNQGYANIKIDGYGYYFPKKPIKDWVEIGNKRLLGISILIKRAE